MTNHTHHNKGNLFVVAAPSGGGKTSLVKKLIETIPGLQVSVSHTTRAIRPGERDGRDYYFVAEAEFNRQIEADFFLEHAEVFGHYYGTSIQQLQEKQAQGYDVLLDIDWQGAKQIKQLFPEAVLVFILPPSLDALRARLMARAQDKPEVIEARMQKAQSEMQHFQEFDYLVINDDFDKALAELSLIVLSDRLKTSRQILSQAHVIGQLLA